MVMYILQLKTLMILKKIQPGENYQMVESELLEKIPNELVEEDLTNEDVTRNNYWKMTIRNFNDGDDLNQLIMKETTKCMMSLITLISDEARVYKGGSWLDRSYYLDPAQRRFLPEYMTTNFIGFRCAMSYLVVQESHH